MGHLPGKCEHVYTPCAAGVALQSLFAMPLTRIPKSFDPSVGLRIAAYLCLF